ncbi:hypothetical protein OAU13_00955 [bacterium]|nr:hypothetical protein [bacterium]
MLTKFKRNIVDLFIDSVNETLSTELSGTITANSQNTTIVGVGTNFTSAITTRDRIFIGAESRPVVSISNDTILTVSSPFSSNTADTTYKKGKIDNTSYFVFAARQSPYEDEQLAANTIDADYESQIFLHDEMMFGRKITGSDVIPVIQNKTWSANTIYDIYDDKDKDLIEKNFYVRTNENKVYKCIYNNNGLPSTIEPSHTELGFPPQESDGYRWLFLYELTNEQMLKFSTENYIPVVENINVRKAAVDGAIFNITVEANGSAYPADSGSISTVPGNNYVVRISDNSSSANDFFSNCAITITNDITNFTYVKEIRDYVSNNSGRYVVVKVPFSSGQISNNQPYSIAPYVKIESKTGSNCIAYAVMQNVSNTTFTGSVQSIEIVNPGKGYKQANVTIQTSVGFGSGASARAIISPSGGHGSNVKDELYCQSVGVGVEFSNSSLLAFSSDVEFRTVGIVKNLLSANTVGSLYGTVNLVANSLNVTGVETKFTSQVNVGDFIIYSDEEKEVAEIVSDTSLRLVTPFSYTVVAESYDIRRRYSNTYFNQTVYITANTTTPAILQPGEFIVGSDGAGGGSQSRGKVAYANTSTIVLTGVDKDETRGNTIPAILVNDIQIEGVGYNVSGADTPAIAASGAKYSKVAGNTYITTIPDCKLYSGEILYIQNLLPIQRSNTTNEQIRLIIKF